MAHFVGGRVLFNESFNASYFFLPIGSTLHTFTECNWRCWWKKWMEKHEEKEKMWKKRENGWKNSLTKWPLSRQMVGEERCEAEEQENAPHTIFFTKTEMHTWYSSGQMTLIQPDELLPFQNLQNNNSGHLCAKLSRLIPAFENVQNTHFSWLNIFARLPCPF